MIDKTDLFFIARVLIASFLITNLSAGISLQHTLVFVSMFSIIFFSLLILRKTKIVSLSKKIDSRINLTITNLILGFLWAFVYLLSFPFLKLWSSQHKRKPVISISLSNFDFNSQYRCNIKK
jgi:hypothetical protein